MFRKKEDRICEIRENMRGGKGKVVLEHIFKKEEIKAKVRLCAQLNIAAGCSIGEHVHTEEDEIFIVLKGKGKVKKGDKEIVVKEGDAILTGNGEKHSVINDGNEELQILAIIIQY